MAGLVIVGGSYAGLNMAQAARQHGYGEPIVMLTDEQYLPYHRPPLSKGFLTGDSDVESLLIKGEKFYEDQQINVVLGARAEAVEREGRVVTKRGVFAFDALGIVTGTRAREIPVPGTDLDGVVSLRSLADAEAIKARMDKVRAVAIVGGGFIGLELAASFAKSGIDVQIFEAAPRVMARIVGETISDYVEQRFASEGVALCCGLGIEEIEGRNGKVAAVRDTKDKRHPVDMVVMAVGATPNTELVEPLGLADQFGVRVDVNGRTLHPGIYAAGDCAFGPNIFAGRDMRLESVQNATDQAKAAGAAIAGAEFVNDAVPWFWSDQFDMKLQMVGFVEGANRQVVRGSIEDGKFSVFHLKDTRIVCIESVNAVSDHVAGRKLLKLPHSVDPEMLRDTSVKLRDLVST
ncbi:NAD(P)/FAD-dependent oxidoreductase [Novosphingobium malaysiense]|uniref:Pyridine nucleotide-disulfide oxidoreductase n=1 Tax=Novosphingobium malaysiense TaxID=1348853 RepID=A0A0B1ZKW6_9SPHN|nr:FAD-dependent oxidoreductase [Novosphingobium malaysiense]KHK89823.1 hypothetical protein LK12_18045 [Novosphingobium malaysiense]